MLIFTWVGLYIIVGLLIFFASLDSFKELFETDKDIQEIEEKIGYRTIMTFWCIQTIIIWPYIILKGIIKSFK